MRKVNDLTWDVTLKPDVKFADGTPVTAEHVADCLNELNEKNDSAQSSLGKLTATPLGELDGAAVVGLDANSSDDTKKALTVRIESERPTHVMDAVLAEVRSYRVVGSWPALPEHPVDRSHFALSFSLF